MKSLLLICSLVASTACLAQDTDVVQKKPLQVSVSTKKVFLRGTKEEKIEAVRADVGDIIEYTLTYKNTSYAPVKSVRAALPIPDGYSYVQGSAQPNLDSAPNNGYLVWTLGSLQPQSSVAVSAKLKLFRIPKVSK